MTTVHQLGEKERNLVSGCSKTCLKALYGYFISVGLALGAGQQALNLSLFCLLISIVVLSATEITTEK